MAGGVAGIDEEIAVHLRDLRAADAQTSAAGGVDQLPRAMARRVLEGRAAGLFANRLRRLAVALHLLHPLADRFRRGDCPPKARGGEDDRRIDGAIAIGELHVAIVEDERLAIAAEAGRFDQNVFSLRAIGAGVHAQRAADGAGNAEEEFEPADSGRSCRLGHAFVERGGARADDLALSAGVAEGTGRQADHDARHAAIAHDQVRADADDMEWKFVRKLPQKIRKVIVVRWRKKHLRRTADTKPRQLGQRLVGEQPPAQVWHRGFKLGRDVGKGHAKPSNSSWPGLSRPPTSCRLSAWQVGTSIFSQTARTAFCTLGSRTIASVECLSTVPDSSTASPSGMD